VQFESVSKTHRGLVRETNEDSSLEMPAQGVFGVADGMGGEEAGEEASAQVIATVRRVVENSFQTPPADPPQIEATLREALREANREVYEISVREPGKRGLGSTASILCLHRGRYFIAHVGDSRVYLARRGRLRQLTRDHTLVWSLYERGLLAHDQLEKHPERHLLTQCVGSARPIAVDTTSGECQAGDLFLICSDGLTGYAAEERMGSIVMDRRLGLEARADRLIEEALKAGGGDNVSVVLAQVTESGGERDWKTTSEDETVLPDELTGSEGAVRSEGLPGTGSRGARRSGTRVLLGILALAVLIAVVALVIHARGG
jgi:protein phosphatase